MMKVMKMTWSKHTSDWIKLCYDLLKVIFSLVVLGPIVTQKSVSLVFITIGLISSLALLGLAVYLRERG